MYLRMCTVTILGICDNLVQLWEPHRMRSDEKLLIWTHLWILLNSRGAGFLP